MARLALRSLQRHQRETHGFAVGDRVEHLGSPVLRDGRVTAIVNYGQVAHVTWSGGFVGSHPVTALTPHVEGA